MKLHEIDQEMKVTKLEALKEVRKHGISEQEFLSEKGDKEEYGAMEVLEWLGY